MNTAAPAVAPLRWTPRRLSGPGLLISLGALLVFTLLWAAGQGAYSLPLSELQQLCSRLGSKPIRSRWQGSDWVCWPLAPLLGSITWSAPR